MAHPIALRVDEEEPCVEQEVGQSAVEEMKISKFQRSKSFWERRIANTSKRASTTLNLDIFPRSWKACISDHQSDSSRETPGMVETSDAEDNPPGMPTRCNRLSAGTRLSNFQQLKNKFSAPIMKEISLVKAKYKSATKDIPDAEDDIPWDQLLHSTQLGLHYNSPFAHPSLNTPDGQCRTENSIVDSPGYGDSEHISTATGHTSLTSDKRVIGLAITLDDQNDSPMLVSSSSEHLMPDPGTCRSSGPRISRQHKMAAVYSPIWEQFTRRSATEASPMTESSIKTPTRSSNIPSPGNFAASGLVVDTSLGESKTRQPHHELQQCHSKSLDQLERVDNPDETKLGRTSKPAISRCQSSKTTVDEVIREEQHTNLSPNADPHEIASNRQSFVSDDRPPSWLFPPPSGPPPSGPLPPVPHDSTLHSPSARDSPEASISKENLSKVRNSDLISHLTYIPPSRPISKENITPSLQSPHRPASNSSIGRKRLSTVPLIREDPSLVRRPLEKLDDGQLKLSSIHVNAATHPATDHSNAEHKHPQSCSSGDISAEDSSNISSLHKTASSPLRARRFHRPQAFCEGGRRFSSESCQNVTKNVSNDRLRRSTSEMSLSWALRQRRSSLPSASKPRAGSEFPERQPKRNGVVSTKSQTELRAIQNRKERKLRRRAAPSSFDKSNVLMALARAQNQGTGISRITPAGAAKLARQQRLEDEIESAESRSVSALQRARPNSRDEAKQPVSRLTSIPREYKVSTGTVSSRAAATKSNAPPVPQVEPQRGEGASVHHGSNELKVHQPAQSRLWQIEVDDRDTASIQIPERRSSVVITVEPDQFYQAQEQDYQMSVVEYDSIPTCDIFSLDPSATSWMLSPALPTTNMPTSPVCSIFDPDDSVRTAAIMFKMLDQLNKPTSTANCTQFYTIRSPIIA